MKHRVYVTHGAEQRQELQVAFQARIWTQQWIIWKYKFLRNPAFGLIRIFCGLLLPAGTESLEIFVIFFSRYESENLLLLWYLFFFFFFPSQHFVSKHYWIFTDEELWGRVVLLCLSESNKMLGYVYGIHIEHTPLCTVVRIGQNAVSFRSILVFTENALQESWGQTS